MSHYLNHKNESLPLKRVLTQCSLRQFSVRFINFVFHRVAVRHARRVVFSLQYLVNSGETEAPQHCSPCSLSCIWACVNHSLL